MAIAIRDAYGVSLAKYGKENKSVVVLDADVSGSTKSAIFGKECPDRFFNVGISEANMGAMACGFASSGKIPFINTFATFLTSNCLLSLRALASYNSLNVKVMGGYGGLSDAYDGPSHHSLDDLAIMSALPNFTVLVASDEVITDWIVKSCIETEGPTYVRLSRDTMRKVYDENDTFEIGKAKLLREGKDVTVIACGTMVGKAMEAAEELAPQGIDVRVVDMFSIKPIDEQAILESVQKTGKLVIAQEHNRIGGLCDRVCSVIAKAGMACRVEFVAMDDCHAECGDYNQIFAKYKLDAQAVKEAILRLSSK